MSFVFAGTTGSAVSANGVIKQPMPSLAKLLASLLAPTCIGLLIVVTA